jgi:hypothetical protein
MAEVCNLARDENVPAYAPSVIIERAGIRFKVTGFSPGYVPDPFDSFDEALRVSTEWAEANNVPVVYIRDIP